MVAGAPSHGYPQRVRSLRLTHPDLPFWVDVRVREFDGRWLAVADLAGQPEIGVGTSAEAALGGLFAVFGPRLAEELRFAALVSLHR